MKPYSMTSEHYRKEPDMEEEKLYEDGKEFAEVAEDSDLVNDCKGEE